VIALEDISLEIQSGEFVGVIGPNGSGKTTLCRAVLGLMAPLKGHLKIFDCACDELRCHHRAKIGYLPQKGVVDRNFPVTVLETVMMGRYGALGLFARPSGNDRKIALDALAHVGMEGHRDSALGHLSGGQQQRVFIARALAQQPQVLLLDEPTTGLDPITSLTVDEEIVKLRDLEGVSSVLVTHQLRDAFFVAEHAAARKDSEVVFERAGEGKSHQAEFIMLKDGGILFEGNASELRTAARTDEYLQSFLS